jgi:phosphoadenosine phosphosulfate reductase
MTIPVSGLDPQVLHQAWGPPTGRIKSAHAFITEHLARSPERPGYVSWSGGKDSTVVAHLATTISPEIPVVFFHSGLEFDENVTYMNTLAAQYGWNFHTLHATPDALTLLQRSGEWTHSHEVLPERINLHQIMTGPAAEAAELFGPNLLWGLRAAESETRRRALTATNGQQKRADGSVSAAPIWRWTDQDVWRYLHAHNIVENPVYSKLRALGADETALRVGLVVDGNALDAGRLMWVRRGWPELHARLIEVLPRLSEYR